MKPIFLSCGAWLVLLAPMLICLFSKLFRLYLYVLLVMQLERKNLFAYEIV